MNIRLNKNEIRDLNQFYRDYPALMDIALNVELNNIKALIGPTGRGKSPFFKSINRMNYLITRL